MKTGHQSDLRVQKTQKAIHNTFKKMICEMDASEITVRELTERAGIHRKTFYLHYTCIGALYEDILTELAEHYFNEIDSIPCDASFKEVNRVFFTFMASQEPYIERMICTPSYQEYCSRLFTSMLRHNRDRHNPYEAFPAEEQDIINTFLSTGSLNLYRQWIHDKKQPSLDRLIELSGELFTNGISGALQKVDQ